MDLLDLKLPINSINEEVVNHVWLRKNILKRWTKYLKYVAKCIRNMSNYARSQWKSCQNSYISGNQLGQSSF